MIRVRAPFRISFFGGGTDFEEYYKEYGGAVLSTTIDKYCYITLRDLPPFYEYKSQFSYSRIERFNDPDELKHPLVRNALKTLPHDHIQISYDADLPACSGLGTSSAFAVALLQGLHAKRGEYPDKAHLAAEAVSLERELCGEAGGVQDQYAAAFGGFNKITFSKESVNVNPLSMQEVQLQRLEENLLLVFTGFTRFSDLISDETKQNIPHNIQALKRMHQMVAEGEKLLAEGSLDDFGRLLGEGWKLKQSLSKNITNSVIDEVYEVALNNGALGGKLLGSGGGGFLLLYAPKNTHAAIRGALSEHQFVPFHFECSGAKLIYAN